MHNPLLWGLIFFQPCVCGNPGFKRLSLVQGHPAKWDLKEEGAAGAGGGEYKEALPTSSSLPIVQRGKLRPG